MTTYSPSKFVLRDCLGLSSGTLASLTGLSHCDDIHAVQSDFVLWVHQQLTERTFRHWREAWLAYQAR